MENSKIDQHTLLVVQQALRALTFTIAASAKADLDLLAKGLASSAQNARLEPEARSMLTDIADGLHVIADGIKKMQKQASSEGSQSS